MANVMRHHCEILPDTSAVPRAAWDALPCRAVDPFWDLRLVRLTESVLAPAVRGWPVLVRDAADRIAAVSWLGVLRLDVAGLSPAAAARGVEAVRRVWPGYLRLRTLYAGLPTMLTQTPLRIAADADATAVARAFGQACRDTARRERATAVLMSPADAEDERHLAALLDSGYVRGDGPPVNVMELHQATFAEYCSALRCRYRRQIRRNRAAFTDAGLRVVRDDGGTAAADRFDDRLYTLYLRLIDERAPFNLIVLPPAFFRGLIRIYGAHAHLFRILAGDTPVAFAISVRRGDTYFPAFACVDPERNADSPLYFNLLYELLAHAMQTGVRRVVWGSTADTFKLRLGSCQRAQHVYVAARGPLALPFRVFRRLLLPPVTPQPMPHVYR